MTNPTCTASGDVANRQVMLLHDVLPEHGNHRRYREPDRDRQRHQYPAVKSRLRRIDRFSRRSYDPRSLMSRLGLRRDRSHLTPRLAPGSLSTHPRTCRTRKAALTQRIRRRRHATNAGHTGDAPVAPAMSFSRTHELHHCCTDMIFQLQTRRNGGKDVALQRLVALAHSTVRPFLYHEKNLSAITEISYYYWNLYIRSIPPSFRI